MNLYLDRESVQTAKEIGNGNMSEGIRGALRAVKALKALRNKASPALEPSVPLLSQEPSSSGGL
jgi:hypothetical protein